MSSDTQSRYDDEVRLYYRVCTNIDRYFLNCSYRTILEISFTRDMINSFYAARGHGGTLGEIIPDSEITKTAHIITYRETVKTGDIITYSKQMFQRSISLDIFTGRVQDFLRIEKVDYSANDLQYIESIKLLSML